MNMKRMMIAMAELTIQNALGEIGRIRLARDRTLRGLDQQYPLSANDAKRLAVKVLGQLAVERTFWEDRWNHLFEGGAPDAETLALFEAARMTILEACGEFELQSLGGGAASGKREAESGDAAACCGRSE
jgi:hypothetical protein